MITEEMEREFWYSKKGCLFMTGVYLLSFVVMVMFMYCFVKFMWFLMDKIL